MRFVSQAVLAALALAGVASAQFTFSQLLYNPPGTDGGQEAIEIRGAASASLAGYFFLAIEGDGLSVMGTLDIRQDLSAYSTGANGLLLIRDAATPIAPGTDVANASVEVFDWSPDIENGSNTYVLGFGTPPTQGTDLDVDNDGHIDAGALAGFTVVDAIGVLEGSATAGVDFAYGPDLGFINLPQFNGPTPTLYTPGGLLRYYNSDGSPCAWAGGLVFGTNPGGPYTFDTTGGHVFGFAEQGIATPPTIDLGTPTAVPDSDGDGTANSCDGCPNDPNKSAPGLCGCGIPEGCTLGIDINSISAAVGGSQTLKLFAGAGQAGNLYLILGSLSGTSPGIPVDSVVLPLNFDSYLLLTLNSPNSALLTGSLGFLNGSGQGTGHFNIPATGTLTGLPLTPNHAYIVLNLSSFTVVLASNPAPCTINP